MIHTAWLRALAIALLVGAIGLATAACQPSPALQPDSGTVQPGGATGTGEAGNETEEDDKGEGDELAAGDPEEGKKGFATCAGCHGPDGKGLPNLGKDLHNNAFLAAMTDAEAVAFLKVGRDTTDPLNTTGVAMPPKGGNPAFDDEDLANIVAYVRTLK